MKGPVVKPPSAKEKGKIIGKLVKEFSAKNNDLSNIDKEELVNEYVLGKINSSSSIDKNIQNIFKSEVWQSLKTCNISNKEIEKIISQYQTGTLSSNFSNPEFTSRISQDLNDKADDHVECYSVALYPDEYCNIVNELPEACMELGILELWANDGIYDDKTDQEIASITLEDVLLKINGHNKSGVFLIERNFTEYLSNIKRNATGDIIGAEATHMIW